MLEWIVFLVKFYLYGGIATLIWLIMFTIGMLIFDEITASKKQVITLMLVITVTWPVSLPAFLINLLERPAERYLSWLQDMWRD